MREMRKKKEREEKKGEVARTWKGAGAEMWILIVIGLVLAGWLMGWLLKANAERWKQEQEDRRAWMLRQIDLAEQEMTETSPELTTEIQDLMREQRKKVMEEHYEQNR